jgi:hypothetical protein
VKPSIRTAGSEFALFTCIVCNFKTFNLFIENLSGCPAGSIYPQIAGFSFYLFFFALNADNSLKTGALRLILGLRVEWLRQRAAKP